MKTLKYDYYVYDGRLEMQKLKAVKAVKNAFNFSLTKSRDIIDALIRVEFNPQDNDHLIFTLAGFVEAAFLFSDGSATKDQMGELVILAILRYYAPADIADKVVNFIK